MAGAPYDGGGIATTVAATRAAADDELRALLAALVAEMRAQGTTTVEIKSGYGLTVADEARAPAARRASSPTETTYLGAHVVPPGADRATTTSRLVTGEMLAACAPHARWIDVFCEPASPHAFDGDEARAVLDAPGGPPGWACGCTATSSAAGPGRAARRRARRGQRRPLHVPDRRRRRRAGRRRHRRDPAARRGVLHPLAVPGRPPAARRRGDGGAGHRLQPRLVATPSSMPFCVALAVREMRHDRRPRRCGPPPPAARGPCAATTSACCAPGARADLTVLDAPSHAHLAYRPGVPLAHPLDP